LTYTIKEKLLFPPTSLNKDKLNRELSGKTVLLTGASSGIGEELSYLLGDINCHLILVARRIEKLKEIQRKIKCSHVSILQIDLREPKERAELLSYIRQIDGGLDFFINNAGHSIRRSIYESLDRFHDFERTMAVNYFAPVELLLAIIPLLEKRRGQIINISTVNTLLIPFPKFAAYQSSKQAFDTWFRSAMPELNAKGIATTSMYLPLVRTPMIEPTETYQHMPAMTPLHVARIIGKTIYTKRRSYKPWWIFGGVFASNMFRGAWERIGKRFFK
jgi:short-subunit dehydrogenase